MDAPAPRATPPPPLAPHQSTRGPSSASARGVARVPVPGNSAPSACPAPGDEKGVCVRPAGARTSPPYSRPPCPPAPLRSGADQLGRFLPPDRVDGGRQGVPRSFRDSANERFPWGLGERVRTNSFWGAQQLRRRRGSSADRAGRGVPRQKASAGAAAPPPLPSRSPIELTRTGDSTKPLSYKLLGLRQPSPRGTGAPARVSLTYTVHEAVAPRVEFPPESSPLRRAPRAPALSGGGGGSGSSGGSSGHSLSSLVHLRPASRALIYIRAAQARGRGASPRREPRSARPPEGG